MTLTVFSQLLPPDENLTETASLSGKFCLSVLSSSPTILPNFSVPSKAGWAKVHVLLSSQFWALVTILYIVTIRPPDRCNLKIKVIFIYKLRFQCFDHIAVLTHYGEQIDTSRFRTGTDPTRSIMMFLSLINHWDGKQRSWFNGLLCFPVL